MKKKKTILGKIFSFFQWKQIRKKLAVGVIMFGLSIRKANAVDAFPVNPRPEFYKSLKNSKIETIGIKDRTKVVKLKGQKSTCERVEGIPNFYGANRTENKITYTKVPTKFLINVDPNEPPYKHLFPSKDVHFNVSNVDELQELLPIEKIIGTIERNYRPVVFELERNGEMRVIESAMIDHLDAINASKTQVSSEFLNSVHTMEGAEQRLMTSIDMDGSIGVSMRMVDYSGTNVGVKLVTRVDVGQDIRNVQHLRDLQIVFHNTGSIEKGNKKFMMKWAVTSPGQLEKVILPAIDTMTGVKRPSMLMVKTVAQELLNNGYENNFEKHLEHLKQAYSLCNQGKNRPYTLEQFQVKIVNSPKLKDTLLFQGENKGEEVLNLLKKLKATNTGKTLHRIVDDLTRLYNVQPRQNIYAKGRTPKNTELQLKATVERFKDFLEANNLSFEDHTSFFVNAKNKK